MRFTGKALAIIVLFLPQFMWAGGKTTSLIFVEYQKGQQVGRLQNLMRYDFREGNLVATELILSNNASDLDFSFFTNRLYKNRYLVTGRGHIVDIRDKHILFQPKKDDNYEFCGIEQDRVFLRRFVGKDFAIEIYFYNLKNGKNGKLHNPGKWALPGIHSPDDKLSITNYGTEIRLHDLHGNIKSLGTGFDSPQSGLSSFTPVPPLLWLDNENILTQTDHGNMVILKIDGSLSPALQIRLGTDEEIRNAAKPCKKTVDASEYLILDNHDCDGHFLIVGNPTLFRDVEGRIIYNFARNNYVLDIHNKTYSLRDRIPAENGFDLLFTEEPCIVRYQGTEIGRCPAQYDPPTTSSGYFASTKAEMQGTQPRVMGINVWNKITKQWQFFPVDWLTDLVGWIEE